MRPKPIALTLATAAVTGALAAVAGGAPPARTPWTRVDGPKTVGNQLALARTDDGTLHVIWNRGAKPPGSIVDARFSPSGAKLGTTTVAGSWAGAQQGVALLVMPDKTLRLFVTGSHGSPSSPLGGVSSFSASASGTGWTLQPDVWGGAFAASGNVIGAALAKDGQVVTGWRGYAAVGIPPASIPENPYAPSQIPTHLAADAASGAVVLSGVTADELIFVQQVAPSPGKAVKLYRGAPDDFVEGTSGRIGAPGVYVVYADQKAVHLYRYGGGSRTIARGPYTSATVCAGPEGRLWLAWGDSNNELFVTRTSRAAGTLEPVQKLTLPPQSTDGLRVMECEGSAGPLDLFAQVFDQADLGSFWHTHVLPRFSVRAHAAKGKVTVIASDAGDKIAGVSLKIGGKHLRTDAKGHAVLTLKPGSYTVTATATGYAPAAATVTVR